MVSLLNNIKSDFPKFIQYSTLYFFFLLGGCHKTNTRTSSPTYVEEQKAIKESFKDALNNSDDDEDILKPRVKSKEQLVKFT